MNFTSVEIEDFKRSVIWKEILEVVKERIEMVTGQLQTAPPQTMRIPLEDGEVKVILGVEPLQAEIETLRNLKFIPDRLLIDAEEEEEENAKKEERT